MDDYFRFPCPTCGKRLKAEPEAVGRKAHCNKCGARFVVPAVAATAAPEPPAPTEQAATEFDRPDSNLTSPASSAPARAPEVIPQRSSFAPPALIFCGALILFAGATALEYVQSPRKSPVTYVRAAVGKSGEVVQKAAETAGPQTLPGRLGTSLRQVVQKAETANHFPGKGERVTVTGYFCRAESEGGKTTAFLSEGPVTPIGQTFSADGFYQEMVRAAMYKSMRCDFDGNNPQVTVLSYGRRVRISGVLTRSDDYGFELEHCRLVAH